MVQTQSDDDELLDVVDDNDLVVGTITHANAYTPEGLNGCFIRASNCFIINSKHQLWIPRRTADKKIAPSGLDYSAGGHVGAGESYEVAMVRELAEELNLRIEPSELLFIGKQTPKDAPPYFYFSALFLYQSDEAPSYNHDDFVGFEWLGMDELKRRLQNGEKAKDSLLSSLDLVSAYVTQDQGNQ